MQEGLKSNIWKYFLLILTNRRNYIPILSIYFLTLPNTTAQQIGLFTGIGWIVGFLLEIPSGYISDTIGHKKTLILAKFFMLISTLFFVFGKSIVFFTLGSSFIALGFAFTSGTSGAFLHNTLVGLKKEKEYGDIDGKIKAKASFVSAAMILVLPLLTSISLLMPIQIYLIFDVIGIFVAISLCTPKMKYDADDIEGEKLWSLMKSFRGTGFYTISLFLGFLGGFLAGITPFKELFAESLGMPIIFIGSIMALSRFVWFIVGHNFKILKNVKIKNLLFYETFLFSGLLIITSQLRNPYLVGLIIATLFGYYHGRKPLIEAYFLDNFLVNKRYKATMISIKQQISKLFQAIVVFGIGFVMVISFSMGFLVAGICLFVLMFGLYPFVREALKK